MLRKYVQGSLHKWDDYVEPALWATRIRKHSTTGYSPYFLVYGRDPKLPGDELKPFICSESMQDPRTIADIAARESASLGQHRASAEAKLKAMGAKDKERWDSLIKPVGYEVGDLVMAKHESKFGLEPRFKGSYIITQEFDDFGTYSLETVEYTKIV